jgi:hypothetical protein
VRRNPCRTPRAHPVLDRLADPPVLPVDQVPELHGVRRVEAVPRDLVGKEQEIAIDPGPAGREWPQREGGDVIAGQAEHHVRVQEFTLVSRALVLAETGERRAGRRAVPGEGGRAVAVRDPRVPVELPAAVLERRHDLAQLRMDGAAVIALVVVLDHDLPVGGDVVRDPPRDPKVRERMVVRSPRDVTEPLHQGRGGGPRQVDEHEPAPRVDRRPVEREPFLPETVALGQERCDPELAVESVRPRVVRAADRTFETPVRGARVLTDGWSVQHQARPAVATDVVERAEVAGAGPHDQQTLACDVDVHVVARSLERLRPSHEEPLAVEDRLGLAFEPLRGSVREARQRVQELDLVRAGSVDDLRQYG